MDKTIVCVFGTGRAKPGDPVYALAEQIGRALAEAGFTVANGGYGGTMQASAKGAAAAGGTVVGVTCSAFGSSVANEYVTRTVVTDSLDERLQNLIKAGRAYVVLPGGTGTLVELATAWELINKGLIPQRPLACVGQFWRPVIERVLRVQNDAAEHVVFADDAQQLSRFFPPLGGDG